jgi:hypothetical protein
MSAAKLVSVAIAPPQQAEDPASVCGKPDGLYGGMNHGLETSSFGTHGKRLLLHFGCLMLFNFGNPYLLGVRTRMCCGMFERWEKYWAAD